MSWTWEAWRPGAIFTVAWVIPAFANAQVVPTTPLSPRTTVPGKALAVTPTFFETLAVPIKARRFSNDWERAWRDASAIPQMQNLIAPARGLPALQQISYVQAAVSRTIRWRSDTTQYGRHDYWASAAETLASGRGDMEDRAIVKMQALRALGFPTSDLYLTFGRDSVGGPQTVVIVRQGVDYLVLDDTGGPPYAPAHRPEYHPVLTFGDGAAWVHKQVNAHAQIAANERSTNSSSDFAPPTNAARALPKP